jgi:hypothetical protein
VTYRFSQKAGDSIAGFFVATGGSNGTHQLLLESHHFAAKLATPRTEPGVNSGQAICFYWSLADIGGVTLLEIFGA